MSESRTSKSETRARVAALLAAEREPLERGALTREMDALTSAPGFAECADLWAPALYARDAAFFTTFLLRHLDERQEKAIRALLPLAERDGNDELFRGLYRRVARADTWNAELLALARSPEPEEVVRPAVERRGLPNAWLTLEEETALALYQRAPATYGAFIVEHIHAGPRSRGATYHRLLEAARAQGDDDFSWQIFRQIAGPGEWAKAARELLSENVPPERIVAELDRRHPVYARDLDGAVMAELLERYRATVLPYIERNVSWIGRKSAPRLLATAEALGDDALYWRVFYLVGSSPQWNAALREVVARPPTAEALAPALRLRTPPATLLGRWVLAPETALALYRRDASLARPLIEQWLVDVDEPLFAEAERAGDEELLDFLSTRLLWDLAWVVYDVYPTPSERQWKRPKADAPKRLARWGEIVTARFDRLYAASPETYVAHAARILSRFEEADGWSFKRNVEHNPAFVYLFTQHRAAWLRSPDAMREVLESPNPLVQVVALAILGEGGADAAARAAENVALLRALLLGEAPRNVKKRALLALELAARESPVHAEAILPSLAEALHFRADRAIDERVMVSYVRLRSG